MFLIVTTSLILFSIYLLHIYISWNYDFWKKRKIYYVKPKPFFGNFTKVVTLQSSMHENVREMYEKIEKPFFGLFMFGTPQLFIRDEELIKRILVQDFENFPNHTLHCSQQDGIAGNLLVCMKGNNWKIMRQKQTPFFTSKNLKNMMGIFNGVAQDMVEYLEENYTKDSIETKEFCAKYTTDVIAKTAFAIDAKSFVDEGAEIRKIGRLFFDNSPTAALRFILYSTLPSIVDFFKISLFNPKIHKFLRGVFEKSIETRQANGKVGNDLIDLILELKKDKEFCENNNFRGDKIIAQAVMFFVAGFETVSGAIAFTLYELALNPDIQKRAREEVKETMKKHESLTHDCIQDMKYIHMIFSETLRKYPALPFLDRMCISDYEVPGSHSIIEKGVRVYIPVAGLHYDPKYFPNPEKFDPERFEDKSKIPFVYMPFGQGPRSCIGGRFALLVAKISLAKILMNFEVTRSPDTPVPIVFDPSSPVLASKFELALKFNKLA